MSNRCKIPFAINESLRVVFDKYLNDGLPAVFRLFALIVTILVIYSVPASGMKSQLYPLSSDTLSAAASRLRARDFEAAIRYAESSPASGARDFITGMAAYRSSNWMLAATSLSSAAKRFDLLADYALLYQAQALKNLERPDDALAALTALQKHYPGSTLQRQAMLMNADICYEKKDYPSAATTFQQYIEKYPSGSDAINAQFRLALCKEASGDTSTAVKLLRNLWLANPSSPLASRAEEELKRIQNSGTIIPPYTTDELFRRASTLFDLKKFSQAAADLKNLSRAGQSSEALERLELKTGQALYRARKYREAEQHLSAILNKPLSQAHAAEATYWLARTRDRCERHDEAIEAFLKIPVRWPSSAEADNALFEAALIRKSQKRWADVKALSEQMLGSYPSSALKTQAWWEAGWSSYQQKDWESATKYFRKLADSDTGRDRALYWLSRSQSASGDKGAAESTFAKLQREYPLSYYSVGTVPDNAKDEPLLPSVTPDTLDSLPLPSNFERTRALISFGMFEEARRELSSSKGKNGNLSRLLGIARLYLEMDDFNGAYNLIGRESPPLATKEGRQVLALKYPLPFRDLVMKSAEASKVSPQIVYAVIRSESSFSPSAVSPAGAVGLMQLMPATAGQMEGKSTVSKERLTDPKLNISYGVRHFRDMLVQYDGDMISTVASYNAGGSAVDRWKKQFGTMPPAEFIEQIPYGETREYVKKVLAASAIYSRLYGLTPDAGPLPLPPRP